MCQSSLSLGLLTNDTEASIGSRQAPEAIDPRDQFNRYNDQHPVEILVRISGDVGGSDALAALPQIGGWT